MRIGFIFGGVFWGVLLILFGAGVLLKTFFNFDIPLFQIFLSFLLIYIGLRIIFGGFGRWNFSHYNMGRQNLHYDPDSSNNEFGISFGSGFLDLSDVKPDKSTAEVKINTTFAECCVLMNPDTPAIIKVNSSFGEVTFPDGNCLSFGNSTYKTKNFNKDLNHLNIDANLSFGSLRFVTSREESESFCRMDRRARRKRRKEWSRYN